MQHIATTTEAYGTGAVLAVVEDQRRALSAELKTLTSIAAKLGGNPADEPSAPRPLRPKRKPGRRASRPHPNSQQAASERSEELFSFLVQKGSKVAPRVAREALNMTETQLRAAGERLMKQGRMRRTGERNNTLYEAIAAGGKDPNTPEAPSVRTSGPPAATIPGRILTLAGEKEGVTLGGLMADLGLSEGRVREECGKLIAEEELRMARRNGNSIYVVAGPVA